MSGPRKITTPRGSIVQIRDRGGNTSVRLIWDSAFAGRANESFSRAQKLLDNEILRGCAPLVPFRTGMLQKSGLLGTVPGSGSIYWVAPHAKAQYYKKGVGSNGEGQRGGYWFVRWKNANGKEVIARVRSLAGKGI